MEERTRKALFSELHRAIDESAFCAVKNITTPDLVYPPGVELTSDEAQAMAELELSDAAKSALGKIIKDACAYPSFHLFSFADGVTDPISDEIDEWYGLSFIERTADSDDPDAMLHDQFFESYWDDDE